jgi:dihydroorotate dehydrogenase
MVYQGPNIVSKISNELIEIIKNHGVKNISELVGTKK